MRTDPRYARVRTMLTDDAVPRLANGGIALCHFCQRDVYFANGFLELLIRQTDRMARNFKCVGLRKAAEARRTARATP